MAAVLVWVPPTSWDKDHVWVVYLGVTLGNNSWGKWVGGGDETEPPPQKKWWVIKPNNPLSIWSLVLLGKCRVQCRLWDSTLLPLLPCPQEGAGVFIFINNPQLAGPFCGGRGGRRGAEEEEGQEGPQEADIMHCKRPPLLQPLQRGSESSNILSPRYRIL